MNIYEKLQKVRVDLQKSPLKKSGYNSFAKYSYFELGDFLPTINELMETNKVTTSFSVYGKNAVLKVINAEKPEELVRFEIPVAEANLKGATPIQELGARITYLRRYAMLIAFEIVENDVVDSQANDNKPMLSNEDVAKINNAKTLEELGTVVKAMVASKGEKYKTAIGKVYTDKKAQLEEQQ